MGGVHPQSRHPEPSHIRRKSEHGGELCYAPQAGEDERLSAPASVDVASLFGDLEVASLREVSLTGSHAAASRAWPSRDFAPGDPFFNVDPALAVALAGNASGPKIPVPEGFDQAGRWLGGSGLAVTSGAGGSGFKPSTPLEDFSAEGAAGRGWLSAPKLVVALQPAEIRTFELTLRRTLAGTAR